MLEGIVEDHLRGLLADIDAEADKYGLILRFDNSHWDRPFPNGVKTFKLNPGNPELFLVNISDWTREESYFRDDFGDMYIKTAFGDLELSANIPVSDIYGIVDEKGALLYVRVREYAHSKKTMRELMNEHDGTKATRKIDKKSMDSMLKNNPHLKKGKK